MRYKVSGTMCVSCWCEIEAESLQDALRRIASMMEPEPAEHSIDGSYPNDEYWHFSIDGTPDIGEVEICEVKEN